MLLSTANVEDALRNPGRYTIGESRYILVEYSPITPAIRVLDPVLALREAGLVPIIAHPERNPLFVSYPDLLQRAVKQGCLLQVTASSLTGLWGKGAKRAGSELVKAGLAHFLASDAHDGKRRTPLLSAGVKAATRILGESQAMRLVRKNAEALFD